MKFTNDFCSKKRSFQTKFGLFYIFLIVIYYIIIPKYGINIEVSYSFEIVVNQLHIYCFDRCELDELVCCGP
jgi:hypothetical protein